MAQKFQPLEYDIRYKYIVTHEEIKMKLNHNIVKLKTENNVSEI